MGAMSNLDYQLEQAIQLIELSVNDMTDKQLERIETISKAELWDRYNQPNEQMFCEKDKL